MWVARLIRHEIAGAAVPARVFRLFTGGGRVDGFGVGLAAARAAVTETGRVDLVAITPPLPSVGSASDCHSFLLLSPSPSLALPALLRSDHK